MNGYQINLMRLRKAFRYLKAAIYGSEKEFTTGNLNRAIFMLAVPMVLEMVMESLFAVVDIFFVSKLGVNAVATIGLTESVLTLVYSIAIGLSMATTAMVARRVGEKNFQGASEAAVQAVIIASGFSICISAVGIIWSSDILRLLGASEALIEEGSGYTKIMLTGNITIMLLFLINAIFRGAGDASLAMRSLWIANGLNILLDPLFIFGLGPVPAFGVEGAAIATTVGRGTGLIYQLYHLLNGKALIKIGWHNIIFRVKILFRLLKVSAGGMGQFIIESASWIFLVRLIAVFGSDALAGYTIAIRIIIFTILPSWGLANAAATLVGQNLGAGLPKRAEKSVWKCAFYNMLFLAVMSFIFIYWAKDFMMLFTSEVAVIDYGTKGLQYICVGYIFFAYGMVISQAFNGAGDTRTPTIINFFCYWIFQIPFAYLLSIMMAWGPTGIYISIGLSSSLFAIISVIIFKKGKWKLVRI